MGRMCMVCSNPEHMRVTAEMVAVGRTDRAIAEALGGMNRMAVQRHRTLHMGSKPGVVAQQREAADARLTTLSGVPDEPFDAARYLSRDSIAADLDAIDKRLSVAALDAAVTGKSTILATLSAQQLRQAETRARIGEVGGYGRDKGMSAAGAGFSINIWFGERPSEVIQTVVQPSDRQHTPQAESTPFLVVEKHPLMSGGPSAVFQRREFSA